MINLSVFFGLLKLVISGVPLAASYDQFQTDAFRSVFQHMQETSRLIMIYQNQWVSYVCDMNLNDDMDMTDMT